MAQSTSQKRPWLAMLLAMLATGLGHLYLRRWRRALGWLAASFVVTALFVDPTALDAFVTGNSGLEEALVVAPLFLVIGLSTLDAYLLARSQRVPSAVDPAAAESTSCPHCGKELDSDLEFCQWCTKPIEDVDQERLEERDGR
ncbi:zinc ribbon domain-containing protein [Natrinema hispanicum]|uniref:DUF7575 domain-containing protein n=1 Tax=Natrinema hispanicum TaxID=392421 RepID=A0A1I0JAR9_9EURY|nr:zinc ribbon domain-containing protein [Natrinema hispanicum]RZV06624.1 hypothetical protein BDK88_3645 [Natrinema hispanicum]SDD63743.1 hypothetical protein SAMN05192552_103610 [Natrinema hispanicum]SEU06861.1 hypothetical protein SAMN04488694_1369 [Natrinema hispanicum]